MDSNELSWVRLLGLQKKDKELFGLNLDLIVGKDGPFRNR